MEVHKFENYVAVTDELIGFTPRGRTKVWLNPCFAENHPLKGIPLATNLAADFAARKMIGELYLTVEEHIEGKSFPSDFKAEWNPAGFTEAVNTIKDYAAANGIIIPKQVTLPNFFSQNIRVVAPTTTTTTTTVTETIVPAEPKVTRTIRTSEPTVVEEVEVVAPAVT